MAAPAPGSGQAPSGTAPARSWRKWSAIGGERKRGCGSEAQAREAAARGGRKLPADRAGASRAARWGRGRAGDSQVPADGTWPPGGLAAGPHGAGAARRADAAPPGSPPAPPVPYQVGEAGRLDLAAVGPAAAVRDEVNAELALQGHGDRAGDAAGGLRLPRPAPDSTKRPWDRTGCVRRPSSRKVCALRTPGDKSSATSPEASRRGLGPATLLPPPPTKLGASPGRAQPP